MIIRLKNPINPSETHQDFSHLVILGQTICIVEQNESFQQWKYSEFTARCKPLVTQRLDLKESVLIQPITDLNSNFFFLNWDDLTSSGFLCFLLFTYFHFTESNSSKFQLLCVLTSFHSSGVVSLQVE